MKRIFVILIVLLLLADAASAQRRRRSARWKRTRYELCYGIGATNLLGELGGADQIGTDYVKDLEFAMSRPLGQIGLRYKILENVAVKGAFTAGMLKGDDKTTLEYHRNNRNLHFRSMIYEFGLQLEYSIIREKEGHRYRLRKVRGIKGYLTNTYFFAGIGGFYFNPKAKWDAVGGDGKWHALQPIGTEGQGMVPTRKKYSRLQVCIPVGFGFKYGLNRRWTVGLEYGLRKTFTDYIDDVSSTYYDNDLLRQAKGDMAADLADPSLSRQSEIYNMTGPNQQRGDSKDKDAYMFLVLSFTYKMKTARNGMPKF
ncbi:MAG: outer membrane beta-barrel protein [Bacteroidetes bacterium]|nr:outer membrane beta-barrel protein [Bacteroidota bacterium]